MNLWWSQLRIENSDHLILVIKIWHNDIGVGYDGAYKLMNMTTFFILESTILEENNKLIEEQGLDK
jgi:hypothetical protein